MPITWLRWHLVSGGIIAGLLLFRCVWGALGTTHARFASFAYRPRDVSGHLRRVLAGQPDSYLGHNPLGAMMVFALLAVLAVLIATGTVALGGMVKQGPARAFTHFALGESALQIHYWVAILLAVMIGAHFAGVLLESKLTRENLARAMVTGRKVGSAAASPIRSAPVLAACIVIGGLAGGGFAIRALANLPARGVPPPEEDPEWAEQCGACHFAYPPSLAPAAVWTAILGDLHHHFGNSDASLGPDIIARFRAYALANSAEHWDTLPAHVFRRPRSGRPRAHHRDPLLAASPPRNSRYRIRCRRGRLPGGVRRLSRRRRPQPVRPAGDPGAVGS